MASDNTEILVLLAESMRAADRDREENMRRFERLTQVMVDGFGRLEDKISGTNARIDHLTERVDHLTGRVDHLTEEVKELKVDMREVKAQAQETNRRLASTFNQTGRLTEAADATSLRVSHVETRQATDATEFRERLGTIENIVLPKAS